MAGKKASPKKKVEDAEAPVNRASVSKGSPGKKASPKKKVEDAEAPVNRASVSKGSPGKSNTVKPKMRATGDEALLFLYHCFLHNGGAQVDYAAVSKELGISKNATYKRFHKLKALCEELDTQRAQGDASNNSALESPDEPKGQAEDPVKEAEDLEEDLKEDLKEELKEDI